MAATRSPAWMAANVAVAQDPAGDLKPAKDKSTERIDGIVALIMGRAWS
jgi:phage terminase large subunit-like protein